MAQHPNITLVDEDTITFTNQGVTVEATVDVDLAQPSIIVESVTLTNNTNHIVELPITDRVVPTPVVVHLLPEL
jgi:hypothetical protein